MNPSSNLWHGLTKELTPRLEAVGFRAMSFPAASPPDLKGVVFLAFEAAYGLLFCVQVSEVDAKTVTIATNFACDVMRDALAKSGANDWSRDGYVLAAMLTPPDTPEVKACLRNFEQSRAICRRHVIWPEVNSILGNGNSWTARLDRVTVLSLPEAEAPTALDELQPSGPAFIESIHNRLKSGAPYKAVAEELVRAAREREDFHAA